MPKTMPVQNLLRYISFKAWISVWPSYTDHGSYYLIYILWLKDFIDPEKNPRAGSLGLNQAELKILEEGLENMEKSDLDGDGKFTFEEFLSAMKENENANKLIMQIADA